jgi:putative membrane protein
MVLPLPYSQLIKIFNASWVFSLPFVIVNECGVLTPFVMSLIALAFFGLDQIGAELEGPFGVDDNDLPLLQMGISLFDNLDALMRAAAEKAKQAKQASSMAA